MTPTIYLFSYLLTLVTLINGEQPDPSCLQCICQASSNCDSINLKCPNGSGFNSYCGPYQISRYYWEEGNGIGYDFETCTNLKACAERVIINYMKKYSRDCNGDGFIDCLDYAAIHRMGMEGCSEQSLYSSDYWRAFSQTQCVINPSLEADQPSSVYPYQQQQQDRQPGHLHTPKSYSGKNWPDHWPGNSEKINGSSPISSSTRRLKKKKKQKNQINRGSSSRRQNPTANPVPSGYPVSVGSPSARSGENIPTSNRRVDTVDDISNAESDHGISRAPYVPSRYIPRTNGPTSVAIPPRSSTTDGEEGYINDGRVIAPPKPPLQPSTPRMITPSPSPLNPTNTASRRFTPSPPVNPISSSPSSRPRSRPSSRSGSRPSSRPSNRSSPSDPSSIRPSVSPLAPPLSPVPSSIPSSRSRPPSRSSPPPPSTPSISPPVHSFPSDPPSYSPEYSPSYPPQPTYPQPFDSPYPPPYPSPYEPSSNPLIPPIDPSTASPPPIPPSTVRSNATPDSTRRNPLKPRRTSSRNRPTTTRQPTIPTQPRTIKPPIISYENQPAPPTLQPASNMATDYQPETVRPTTPPRSSVQPSRGSRNGRNRPTESQPTTSINTNQPRTNTQPQPTTLSTSTVTPVNNNYPRVPTTRETEPTENTNPNSNPSTTREVTGREGGLTEESTISSPSPPTLEFRNDFGSNSANDDSILPSNPRPPHLTNTTISISDQCLSCLCESTESCSNKGTCSNSEGPCGPLQVTYGQWLVAGQPKSNFQKCASSLDCSRGILRRYYAKHGVDCNADSDINCVDFALIHKYGIDNCPAIPDDLYKSGYWLNFENCYGFDRR